jgi:hypothetical protein
MSQKLNSAIAVLDMACNAMTDSIPRLPKNRAGVATGPEEGGNMRKEVFQTGRPRRGTYIPVTAQLCPVGTLVIAPAPRPEWRRPFCVEGSPMLCA